MQLDGNLNTFSLRELIEMVVFSSVTGVLELRVGAEIGQIFFRDGQPYHAIAGERVGMEAITAMFEARDTPFRFVTDRDYPDATLWLDPWELIERGEYQAQQWSRVRVHIPSLELLPALRGAPNSEHIHISDRVWPVLAAVDGRRNVIQVAEHLNLVVLDACIALSDLIEQGLIEMRQERAQPSSSLFAPPASRAAAPPAAPSAAPPEPRPSTPGFLERLLADAQAQAEERPDLIDDEAQERKRVSRYVDDRR